MAYKNFLRKRELQLKKSTSVDEVEALREVFFAFFHHTKRNGRENENSGYVKIDLWNMSNNPFYDQMQYKKAKAARKSAEQPTLDIETPRLIRAQSHGSLKIVSQFALKPVSFGSKSKKRADLFEITEQIEESKLDADVDKISEQENLESLSI